MEFKISVNSFLWVQECFGEKVKTIDWEYWVQEFYIHKEVHLVVNLFYKVWTTCATIDRDKLVTRSQNTVERYLCLTLTSPDVSMSAVRTLGTEGKRNII